MFEALNSPKILDNKFDWTEFKTTGWDGGITRNEIRVDGVEYIFTNNIFYIYNCLGFNMTY